MLVVGAALAQTPELRNTSGWFLAGEFVASGVIAFVGPDLLFRPSDEPLTCEDAWCGTNRFDEAVTKALAAERPRGVGTASHVFTMGLVPLAAFSGVVGPAVFEAEGVHGAEDAVVVLDALVLATGFNTVAKVGARRQRPAFHYGRADRTEAAKHPREEFVSFYSGDTTWAFALASSAVTLSALRGYESTPYLAAAAGSLALAGGTMRIVADMHWATDVLAGAATGTAVGVALPLVLHGRVPAPEGRDTGAPARIVSIGGTF